MELSNVMVFCGSTLEKSEILTIPIVQKFIKSREEVGKAVDVDDIDMALEYLYFAGFLERTGEKDEYGYRIYTRYIPPLQLKKEIELFLEKANCQC